jgi:hypothetical protein
MKNELRSNAGGRAAEEAGAVVADGFTSDAALEPAADSGLVDGLALANDGRLSPEPRSIDPNRGWWPSKCFPAREGAAGDDDRTAWESSIVPKLIDPSLIPTGRGADTPSLMGTRLGAVPLPYAPLPPPFPFRALPFCRFPGAFPFGRDGTESDLTTAAG